MLQLQARMKTPASAPTTTTAQPMEIPQATPVVPPSAVAVVVVAPVNLLAAIPCTPATTAEFAAAEFAAQDDIDVIDQEEVEVSYEDGND
jgi:hypothetical protein